VIKNLPKGDYVVTGEQRARTESLAAGDDLALEIEVDGNELDVVVQRQK
jgi:hypothetical protein